jgi:hypothetical protein
VTAEESQLLPGLDIAVWTVFWKMSHLRTSGGRDENERKRAQ